jgi:hypothetical protein
LCLIYVLASLSLSFQVSAINVKLTADRNGTFIDENTTQITMLENESMKFQIQVHEGTETSSGAFSIYKEIGEKTYKLAGKPHFAFAACSCKGSREMPDLNEEYTFIPLSPGKYRAEAQYGGVSRRIDVTVLALTPPASATTTTSMNNNTTSSAASTSTTGQSTTSTASATIETQPSATTLTELLYPATTYPASAEKTQASTPWLPALLGLAVVCACVYFAFNKKRKHNE